MSLAGAKYVGETITMSYSSSGYTLQSVVWGDGSPEGQETSHVYANSGTYEVIVTAKGTDGCLAAARVEVNITNPPTPSPTPFPTPPRPAVSDGTASGDPHFTTFGGKKYDVRTCAPEQQQFLPGQLQCLFVTTLH